MKEESGKILEKVEKTVQRPCFCQFPDKKRDVFFVKKCRRQGDFVVLFCKKDGGNTICIMMSAAKRIQGKSGTAIKNFHVCRFVNDVLQIRESE